MIPPDTERIRCQLLNPVDESELDRNSAVVAEAQPVLTRPFPCTDIHHSGCERLIHTEVIDGETFLIIKRSQADTEIASGFG